MQNMEETMRKKRSARSDDQDQDYTINKKKIKLGKRSHQSSSSSSEQQVCYNNNNNDTTTITTTTTTTTTELLGSTSSSSYNSTDVDIDNHHQPRRGVFDFPWLKEGSGSASGSQDHDQWKLEEVDSLLTQLGGGGSCTTVTTSTGIEFSFPGQCLLPQGTAPVLEDFPDDNGVELFGFGTLESLDCIWSAFT